MKELGIDFEVRLKETGEDHPASLQGKDIAVYLSEKKAEAFKNEIRKNELLITADTIVWINGQSLAKPDNESEAALMLSQLSGKMHEVFTAVTLSASERKKTFVVGTKVYFRKLTEAEIKNYISTFKPFDKAGSYGAQDSLPEGMNPCSDEEIDFLKKIGKTDLMANTIGQRPVRNDAVVLIDKIEGSYFNVMGLPVMELYNELNRF